jgi:eukaryotic-like serine/threonine-protein kinase
VTLENAAAAGPSLVGCSIDERYRLEAQIGVGGLGTVYRATHTKLQRAVAVKLLHESYGASAVQRARFEREAKALAMLEHSNIVSVMDYGVSEDRPYLVMELLEGETLSQCLKRGPMPLAKAISIAYQMLGALAFMHSEGLLHRDVKPSNVFLQRMQSGQDRVKVLDFGLAKFTAPLGASADPTLTRDGSVVGTPAYMSPEQATGESVDARSDVYAVGIILFQMLSGRLPFEGDAIEQLRCHLVEPVPALGRVAPDAEVDAELDALIQRATAKRREERFADAAQMLGALLAIFPYLSEVSREFDSVSTVLRSAPPERDAAEAELEARAGVTDAPTSERLAALSDSSELATRAREVEPGWVERVSARVRGAVRALLLASVRVVATVSVLLVLGTIGVIVLLFRSEADRADLVALRRRVSDRLIERSFRSGAVSREALRGSGGALQPTAAVRGEAAGSGVAVGSASTSTRTNTDMNTGTGIGVSAAGAGVTAPAPGAAASEGTASGTPGAAASEATASGAPALGPPAGTGIAAPAADTATGPAAATSAPSAGGPTSRAPLRAAVAFAPSPAILGPPAARNPWTRPVPRELRAARKLALSGARGGERTALALRTYNQVHPEDARGRLLLAQLYFNRLWRPDSVAQFAAALQVDLSARGAPEVLTCLVALVIQGKVASDAERLIVKAFGSEALPAIDNALKTVKDPKALARLRALSVRLAKS